MLKKLRNLINGENKHKNVHVKESHKDTDTCSAPESKQKQVPSTSEQSMFNDPLKIRPELQPVGFYGVLGSAAQVLCDGYRALPSFVALSLMARICASIYKGNVKVVNGEQETELRMNALLVMKTGGGKGLGEGRAELLIERSGLLSQLDEDEIPLFATVHEGGLSTTEGIVADLRDESTDKNGDIIPGVNDKRRVYLEEEFANIFSKTQSSNSNLSATIRRLFDGGSLSPLIKHDRISCTDPHVSIIGHITPKEFLEKLTSNDLYNGFSNRFITLMGIPKPVIAFPTKLDKEAISHLSEELVSAVKWCNAEERQLTMSDCFKELWEVEVVRISELGASDSLEATLMVRAPHYAIMISGLFAALDKTCTMEEKHLRAALAWIDHWHDSVRYLFNTEREAMEAERRREISDAVLAAITTVISETRTNEVRRTDLSKFLGKRYTSKQVTTALQDLQELPTPPIYIEKRARNLQLISLKKSV
ncbi:hypothetical protein ACFL5R_01925 [Pseudomonadota bacterium]